MLSGILLFYKCYVGIHKPLLIHPHFERTGSYSKALWQDTLRECIVHLISIQIESSRLQVNYNSLSQRKIPQPFPRMCFVTILKNARGFATAVYMLLLRRFISLAVLELREHMSMHFIPSGQQPLQNYWFHKAGNSAEESTSKSMREA